MKIQNSGGPESPLKCPVRENFEQELVHVRTCSKDGCSENSKMSEKGLFLSLHVPEDPSSVQFCVLKNFKHEEIEKTCEKCNEKILHSQESKIRRLPRIMLVHFQRLTPEMNKDTVGLQKFITL